MEVCWVRIVWPSRPSASSPEPLTLANSDLIAGVLEVVVILWEGGREKLATPKHRTLRSKLESVMTKSLPMFFNTLTVSSG